MTIGKASARLMVLADLIAVMAAVFVGAQLAFLVGLPHLSTLIRDPHALWLVFSTWPVMDFGLFSLLAVSIYSLVIPMGQKKFDITGMPARLRSMSRQEITVAIGVSIFLLPLIIAVPTVILLKVLILLCCAFIGSLIFTWANRTGFSRPALWMITALAIGFFGNLFMADTNHRSFVCRTDVQLRSGEVLPCRNLVWLSGKPLWLAEGPQRPRLIPDADIESEKVDEALGL